MTTEIECSEIENRVSKAFREGTPIDRAMSEPVQVAVQAHRPSGVQHVVWRDGRVVELDPVTL